MAIRVYQIAKEYSRSSEEVLGILMEAGCPVSSHTAELDQHAVLTVRAKLGKFNLTVIDGEEEKSLVNEPAPAIEPEPTGKRRKRKSKKTPEVVAPSMKVRVIKTKHEEEEPAAPEVEADKVETPAEPAKPAAPPRPKLRTPAARMRNVNVKQRLDQIHRIAEKRSEPAPAPQAQNANTSRPDPRGRRPSGPPTRQRPGGSSAPGRPRPGAKPDRPAIPGKGTVITAADLSRAFGAPAAGSSSPGARGPGGGGSRFKGGPATAGLHGKKKKKKKRRSEKLMKVGPVLPSASKVNLPDEDLGIIMLSEGVTVKELADKVSRLSKDVIKRLFEKGMMATINDVLDRDLAVELAKDFGYLADVVSFEEDMQIREEEEIATLQDGSSDDVMESRAPIVTIMGHVDHGKTSLLDRIRSARVATGEAGGITQHIGAYAVSCNDRDIVFLDTPGHEAFTKMRARGTSVTDLVILVVAADDGVKPQTIEAIHHAQAAKVPIIIAINKIDKPEANPDRVKMMLTEHSLVVEDFGGDSPCVMVSAKTGDGIQDLLEMILLVSEMLQLKSSPSRKGKGTVIEAQLDRGRGAVATILIQDGSVAVGDYFITGSTYGKIRAMNSDIGKSVKNAGPATPVEILGLNEVPMAGDSFQVVDDEATARQISSFRKEKVREEQLRQRKHMSLDQLFNKMTHGEVKELPLIVKADVQGSVEGISHALEKIVSEKVHLRVIHQGVGNITENDVLLAMASDAIIIGFHIKSEPKANDLADREDIDIRLYDVIYEISKEIEEAMIGMLAPEYHEKIVGKVVVRQIFQVPRMGRVAGSYVEDGFVKRDAKVRVIRNGEMLHESTIVALKRFKDDVNEVKSGYECGIKVAGFEEIEVADQLEVFVMEAVRATEL